MKKRSIKLLTLNKKSISNFQNQIGGLNWSTGNQPPSQLSIGCDTPTINDSCFSLCRDKCNDF